MPQTQPLTLPCLPSERDKKKRKEEPRSKVPSQEKAPEAKAEAKAEEGPEKKRDKPKSLRTTAPSHAKFRSTGTVSLLRGSWGVPCGFGGDALVMVPPSSLLAGLEMETPSLAPVKKVNSAAGSDKYNLKPVPLKRQK